MRRVRVARVRRRHKLRHQHQHLRLRQPACGLASMLGMMKVMKTRLTRLVSGFKSSIIISLYFFVAGEPAAVALSSAATAFLSTVCASVGKVANTLVIWSA